jgi:hypothetical protein
MSLPGLVLIDSTSQCYNQHINMFRRKDRYRTSTITNVWRHQVCFKEKIVAVNTLFRYSTVRLLTFLSTFRLTLVKQPRNLHRQPDNSQQGPSWTACISSVGQGTNLVLFQGRYSTRCKMYARIDEEDSDRSQRNVTLLLKWIATFVTSCRLPYRITRSWNTNLS